MLTIGSSIDFTQADTIRDILGFNSQIIGPSVVSEENFDSDNVAAFNNIEYFVLHTDLVSYGLRTNNRYTQAVAQVLIEADPGSQIAHQPNNPPEISCTELIGIKKNNIRVWLTDQANRLVNTAGETYSMRLVIYYDTE